MRGYTILRRKRVERTREKRIAPNIVHAVVVNSAPRIYKNKTDSVIVWLVRRTIRFTNAPPSSRTRVRKSSRYAVVLFVDDGLTRSRPNKKRLITTLAQNLRHAITQVLVLLYSPFASLNKCLQDICAPIFMPKHICRLTLAYTPNTTVRKRKSAATVFMTRHRFRALVAV